MHAPVQGPRTHSPWQRGWSRPRSPAAEQQAVPLAQSRCPQAAAPQLPPPHARQQVQPVARQRAARRAAWAGSRGWPRWPRPRRRQQSPPRAQPARHRCPMCVAHASTVLVAVYFAAVLTCCSWHGRASSGALPPGLTTAATRSCCSNACSGCSTPAGTAATHHDVASDVVGVLRHLWRGAWGRAVCSGGCAG